MGILRKLDHFTSNFMSRANPLFFRQDGGLDFGPAVWLASALVGLVIFVLTAFRITSVTVAAWAWLGSFISIAAIAGAAEARAFWISRSPTPGAVASGIAQAGAREYGATTHEYDVDALIPPPHGD